MNEKEPRGVRAMAVARWALVAVMGLAALFALNYQFGWFGGGGHEAGAALYYCPMHPSVRQDHPGECPICSMTLVPVAEEASASAGDYYCPMHPEVTSSDPDATCSKCGGMKLQPRPREAAAAGVPGVVPLTLSPERIQLMGMRTEKVVRSGLSPELRTVGTVTASEKGLAVIQTRFAGWIEKLHAEQTGQVVKKGQVLATVYSPELLTAQQEYLNTVRWGSGPGSGGATDLAAGLRQDARRRLELLGISPREIDAIEKTGQPLRAVPIRSPVTGHVVEKTALQGQAVEAGSPLFQIADLSVVWVQADIYEYEMGRIAVGQPASIDFSAYPGERFEGKVTFISPSLDPASRTLRVRIELGNRDLRLKTGMYGTVHLHLPAQEALLVPADAVVDSGARQYLFVALPGGAFEPRQVELGARSGRVVQVIRGVKEGETVVTTANFLLDSESHLQASIQGRAAPDTAPAPSAAQVDVCEAEFDRHKFPDKHRQCVACRAHRGMGSMEDECRARIAKPWK
ncbi:MAG TPA: efflux RND transporter periplasmic adaptor subunit [Kofleriaceae bacterium]|nr:efflux RND transporter periplasmic adaptor subunit [Kofleriaceae bacterium]